LKNIKNVLVANRGEIAIRIIRACRELDIKTVAIFSDCDRDSLHVKMADKSICIGAPPAKKSYLNGEAIIKAAKLAGADAIHPGYGFLAENAAFVEQCVDENICFIGPSPEVIKKMGDKIEARKIAKDLNIPIISGTIKGITTYEEVVLIVDKIGYPLLLKAAAGGGGRGMQLVYNPTELKDAFIKAANEAMAAFGNGLLYVEKYIENARHVEVQVLADHYGNVVYLGERDCTIQRRHQKLIEEAPCSLLTADLRSKMYENALTLVREVGYTNAGTIEFLLDLDTMSYYFIEMNTRLQVEHPVTEILTGIDIVQEQLKIASGEVLSMTQSDVMFRGHAIECRINAENPYENYKPDPGVITEYIAPGGIGVRVDSHCHTGYNVLPYYDSLIAKLIVVANDRPQAIQRMKRALNEYKIRGISTTIPLHLNIVSDKDFYSNLFNTQWLENTSVMKGVRK